EIVIVLGIGDRRFQTLTHVAGDTLAREFEIGQRRRYLLAANELRQKIELLRAYPQHAGDGLRLAVGERAFARLLAHANSPPRLTMRRRSAPPALPVPLPAQPLCAWLCGPTNGRRTTASARIRQTCDR